MNLSGTISKLRNKMKNIVITGSTSGIGYGLADSFLALGCSVMLSGRSQENLDNALKSLAASHDPSRIFGQLCDVTVYSEVQALWDIASEKLGQVDIWINNAGVSHPQIQAGDYQSQQIEDVVGTNVTGALYGTVVALQGMLAQGSGGIYNMEGLGSDGRIINGMALYGLTKSALAYLTWAMAKEVKGTGIVIGGLRPGMVATKLITEQYKGKPEEWERARKIFNILSDRVETVTPWMAVKILENNKNGVIISWAGRRKVLWRFLTAPFIKRKIFE